jgi:protease PrsW
MAAISGRPKDRRRYLKGIKSKSGSAAAKRARYVLDAAVDLARAIASTDDVHSSESEAARSEIARLRAMPAT